MTWFLERRLDFIDWRLLTAGAICRADIMAAFQVSEGQASADLAAFDRAHSGAMTYDKSVKRYVPFNATYRSQRGIKRSSPLVFTIDA